MTIVLPENEYSAALLEQIEAAAEGIPHTSQTAWTASREASSSPWPWTSAAATTATTECSAASGESRPCSKAARRAWW